MSRPFTPYLGRTAAQDHAAAVGRSARLHAPGPHVHVHDFVGGQQSFIHEHPAPEGDHDPNRARPHRHRNGRHSHPHGHMLYSAEPA